MRFESIRPEPAAEIARRPMLRAACTVACARSRQSSASRPSAKRFRHSLDDQRLSSVPMSRRQLGSVIWQAANFSGSIARRDHYADGRAAVVLERPAREFQRSPVSAGHWLATKLTSEARTIGKATIDSIQMWSFIGLLSARRCVSWMTWSIRAVEQSSRRLRARNENRPHYLRTVPLICKFAKHAPRNVVLRNRSDFPLSTTTS